MSCENGILMSPDKLFFLFLLCVEPAVNALHASAWKVVCDVSYDSVYDFDGWNVSMGHW